MGGLEDDDVRGFSMLAREHYQSGEVSSYEEKPKPKDITFCKRQASSISVMKLGR